MQKIFKNLKNKEAPSIISSTVNIKGDISSKGEVIFDGAIKGNIVASTITLGKSSLVQGNIEADKVIVYGKVEGIINAKIVCLKKSAIIIGDIVNQFIEIESGASVSGLVKTSQSEEINLKEIKLKSL